MTTGEAAVDHALLEAVLSCLIPAEDGFPSAGEIATTHIERLIAQRQYDGLLLKEIDDLCRERHDCGFTGLPASEREALLRGVQASRHGLFGVLLLHTYGGYYSHPEVKRLLGLPAGPPQPRGHVLDPFNPATLDQVRRRKPIYREV